MKLTREDISERMVKFFLEHLYMICIISMGVGKTKGSLDCVIKKFGYKRKGLIVAHTVKSRDETWPKEITEWHPQLQEAIDKGFVKIVHKDHILKLPADWYDWIIWDECHYMKDEHIDWIKIYRQYIKCLILMTGTETSNPVMSRKQRNLVSQAVLEFPVEDAIENEIINDYRVKAIEVPLDAASFDEYVNIGLAINKANYSNNEDWKTMVRGKRMHFIYQHPAKVEVIKELKELMPDKRKLMFMATKEACAEVSKYIYHSSTKEIDFRLFARGDIPELASVKQLKTGTNIFGFDTILNQQVNSKYENFMQTLGRLFRLPQDRIGTIYVTYLKDTQDHSWFYKCSAKVPDAKKKVYDLTKVSLEEVVNDTF